MSNYFAQYCALISSVAQLEFCRQAQTLGELLACIKKCWDCTQLTDDELLSEISRLNQTPITAPDVQLAGNWLPYRYQPKRRLVNWLLPVGHATEPFQDETISRYRQQLLLNQIIQPCTSLDVAQQQAENLADAKPAGFIFHLSRCGSTLISGCLSELETTCVFSESPLLTELLLDGNLTSTEQQACLRALINVQAAAFPHRPQMIIKWNAWDIFRWELIREIYPQVPAIFLVRDPVEILASHQRSAGRHMSGDSVLAAHYPELVPPVKDENILDFRVRVLAELLVAMEKYCHEISVRIVDYVQLDLNKIYAICNYFSVAQSSEAMLSVARRMQVNAKSLGQNFSGDSEQKCQQFDATEKTLIERRLLHLYQQVVSSALIERKE